MKVMELDTPVLLLIFNRPETTKKVFEKIKKVKPKKLFIAADGPRQGRKKEQEKCKKARSIINDVNWDCDVHTLFREENLGCKVAVSRAIDWFFENVEKGIILEDDCVPDESFFLFCHKLLNYYENDERIMHISGSNFQFEDQAGNASYYFSNFNLVWGWATWKRAWKYFDLEMKTFPDFSKNKRIKDIFLSKMQQYYFMTKFKRVYEGKIDSWAYIWLYSRAIAGGIAIHPKVNLVQNIGFGKNATHTVFGNDKIKNNVSEKINFPLKHPNLMIPNKEADHYTFRNLHFDNFSAIKFIMKRLLPDAFFDYIKNLAKKYLINS